MQYRSNMLIRTAIVLLGVLLAIVVFVAINNQQAKALNASQWEYVRGYINEYFGGPQYNAGEDGELGFRITKVDLVGRLDTNNDIAPKYGSPATSGTVPGPTTVTGVVGEGDNMENRPVLIDNLMGRTDIIPGTEFRCNWNTDESCFSDSSISAIRQIVDNHKAAGFSTDIVDYCVSAQTAGPTTGGFGIIAQVPGALSSDTSLTPNVYTLKYARNGWRNNVSTITGTNPVASPDPLVGGFAAPSTVADCDASTTNYDLVRCQTNWAISSTGGNIGNGTTNMSLISGAAQSVDIRPGMINTISSAGDNLQVPIDTLFSTAGLANLDPTKTTTMITRTQHGADAAIGLKMLGYNMVADGANINAGIVRWDDTQGEQQVVLGDNLPTQTIAAFSSPGPVDTTGPAVTSVNASSITKTTADIVRVAGEPATMKVEYGTTSGVYTTTVNDTVLNATKTVPLTGLTAATTYYYKATSYDGYANGTVSAEGSFTTLADINPATDKVYYLPWYDSIPANGWIGDWIGVVNMDAVDSANVEIRIGGVMMGTQVIPSGQGWDPTPQNYPGEFGGPVQVICWDCVTKNTTLVVNQRALYGATFSEILAVESADLGKEYVFPWYDNVNANGVTGAWIMVTNTDTTTTAMVDITIDGTVEDTLTILPGAAAFYRDLTGTLIGGPVVVAGQGTEKLVVSQRVLYRQSFNEILGQKIS